MSENPRTISRRTVLGATVAAGAGWLGLSASRLLAGEGAAGEQAVRFLVYVPHWDFDEATQEVFADAVGDALAEAVAKEAVKQEKQRGVNLTGNPDAPSFDPRVLMGGCVTALQLSEKLLKKLGPCVLASFPVNRQRSPAIEPLEREARPRGANTLPYRPQNSGCIFLDVSEVRARGLGKKLKKAWNKAVKPVVKAAGKAAIQEAITRIPGAAAVKAVIGRGPAIRGLDAQGPGPRPGFLPADDVPVSFGQPVVLLW